MIVFSKDRKRDSGLLSCLSRSSLCGGRSRITAEVNRVNVYVGIYVNSLKKLQAIESSRVSKHQHYFPKKPLDCGQQPGRAACLVKMYLQIHNRCEEGKI